MMQLIAPNIATVLKTLRASNPHATMKDARQFAAHMVRLLHGQDTVIVYRTRASKRLRQRQMS